eukprot:s1155_g7.t1
MLPVAPRETEETEKNAGSMFRDVLCDARVVHWLKMLRTRNSRFADISGIAVVNHSEPLGADQVELAAPFLSHGWSGSLSQRRPVTKFTAVSQLRWSAAQDKST